jgi:hypothetical protein
MFDEGLKTMERLNLDYFELFLKQIQTCIYLFPAEQMDRKKRLSNSRHLIQEQSFPALLPAFEVTSTLRCWLELAFCLLTIALDTL